MSIEDYIFLDSKEKIKALRGFPCFIWSPDKTRDSLNSFNAKAWGIFEIEEIQDSTYEFFFKAKVRDRTFYASSALNIFQGKEGIRSHRQFVYAKLAFSEDLIDPYLEVLNRIRAKSCGLKPLSKYSSSFTFNDIVADLCHYYFTSAKAKAEIEYSKLKLPLRFS